MMPTARSTSCSCARARLCRATGCPETHPHAATGEKPQPRRRASATPKAERRPGPVRREGSPSPERMETFAHPRHAHAQLHERRSRSTPSSTRRLANQVSVSKADSGRTPSAHHPPITRSMPGVLVIT
jgi:hypothetical protein